MKTPTQTLRWICEQAGPKSLAGLTHHDTVALLASVAMLPLISYDGAPAELFFAYRAIVLQMQPKMRWAAYHAIASELDWSHREMIWRAAELPQGDKPTFLAAWERGGSAKGGTA